MIVIVIVIRMIRRRSCDRGNVRVKHVGAHVGLPALARVLLHVLLQMSLLLALLLPLPPLPVRRRR